MCVKCLRSLSCSRHLTAFSWGPVGKGAAGQVSNAGHALRVLGDSHTSVPISWEACKVMAVLPFPGESVQAFIQLPRGPWLTGVQNCSADPWAATVASLPSLGGSLVGLAAQTGRGKLSEEQDSAMLPRPALPLLLSLGPGQGLPLPGAARPHSSGTWWGEQA